MNKIINLEDFRTPKSKVFTGRDRGIKVRTLSKIDSLEGKYDKISIVIPEDIGSINSSFLEEFLVNVVTKLGKNEFYSKFEFINNGPYKITADLKEAVERILRNKTALIY